MDPLTVLTVLTGLVAGSTVLGLVLRARSGRVIASDGARDRQDAHLAVPGAEVTLLQLSSPVCSACGVMRRVAEELVADQPGLARHELDITEHPALARLHNVLTTPTTLIIDADGTVRARIVGTARPADVRAAVASVRAAA